VIGHIERKTQTILNKIERSKKSFSSYTIHHESTSATFNMNNKPLVDQDKISLYGNIIQNTKNNDRRGSNKSISEYSVQENYEDDIVVEEEKINYNIDNNANILNVKHENFEKVYKKEKFVHSDNSNNNNSQNENYFILNERKCNKLSQDNIFDQFKNNIKKKKEKILSDDKVKKDKILKIENIREKELKQEQEEFKQTTENFKIENVENIMKRVLENSKKEASVKNRDFLSQFSNNLININMQATKNRFFISSQQSQQNGSSSTNTTTKNNNNNNRDETNRPFTENNFHQTPNCIDIYLYDLIQWKKHEEIWANLISPGFVISPDLEKYIIPPNEMDILKSIYYKMNDLWKIGNKLAIDDNIKNPKAEMKKWKDAFKVALLRWHPDKLIHFLNSINLSDENKKSLLLKKSSIIINHLNKTLSSVMEILKKVNIKKEMK
jgi:hypothetical protein